MELQSRNNRYTVIDYSVKSKVYEFWSVTNCILSSLVDFFVVDTSLRFRLFDTPNSSSIMRTI